MAEVGIDSRRFIRKSINGSDFLAILGIGVCVENYKEFKKEYKEIMTTLLSKRNIKQKRQIYKTSDLIGMGIDSIFFEEFYLAIKDKISKLFVFFSILPSNKIVKINLTSGLKEISAIDFLTKHLDASYPHICAWSLDKGYNDENRFVGEYFLDSFNSKRTNAWMSISQLQNLRILPNGDKTNAIISSADILIHFLDEKLLSTRNKLGQDQIKEVFKEMDDNVDIRFIGEKCLHHLVPLSDKDLIKINKHFPNPTFYVIREKESKQMSDKVFENSPLFDKIVNYCFENGGCFKFFDSSCDTDSLSEHDFLVPVGENATNTIKQFKELGFKFNEFKL